MAQVQSTFIAAAAAALISISTASAAPNSFCGWRVSIDAPTTLGAIAKACNVPYRVLRESNRGVDPSNVRPGEHIQIPRRFRDPNQSVPVESIGVGSGSSNSSNDKTITSDIETYEILNVENGTVQVAPVVHEDHLNDPKFDNLFDEQRDNEVLQINAGGADYEWEKQRSRGAQFGGGSFQKRAAHRIQNASGGRNDRAQPGIQLISIHPAAQLDHQLAECPFLSDENGKQILNLRDIASPTRRGFIEVSSNRHGASECRVVYRDDVEEFNASSSAAPLRLINDDGHDGVYSLPDYSKIGPLRSSRDVDAPIRVSEFVQETQADPVPSFDTTLVSIVGNIVDSREGCLTLSTPRGDAWSLLVGPEEQHLIGKEITVWGTRSADTSCGNGQAMAVSHAIYADALD